MSICIYQGEISLNWIQLGFKNTRFLISLNRKSSGGASSRYKLSLLWFCLLVICLFPPSLWLNLASRLSMMVEAVLVIVARHDNMQRKNLYLCES